MEVTQSRPGLWDPMDCSLLGVSVYGILQGSNTGVVAISFSKEHTKYKEKKASED